MAIRSRPRWRVSRPFLFGVLSVALAAGVLVPGTAQAVTNTQTSQFLPVGTMGTTYSYQLQGSLFLGPTSSGPYTYTRSAGQPSGVVAAGLPPGLGMSPSGLIKGVPVYPEESSFLVVVTDAAGQSALVRLFIEIDPPNDALRPLIPLGTDLMVLAEGGYPSDFGGSPVGTVLSVVALAEAVPGVVLCVLEQGSLHYC